MVNRCSWLLVLLTGAAHAFSQTDSVQLKEVVVASYMGERPILRLPVSVAVIDSAVIAKQPGQSLVPALNTASGVRMEERSPGSYRLSVRGSLLRSPFGVRNTKVYIDDYPLTNAGGEAYLNLIDLNSVQSLEVTKGPDGSLFGANSGGIVRLNTGNARRSGNSVSAGIGAGSYGLFQENVNVQQQLGKNHLMLNESWLHSDGYRQNSALDRRYVQLADRFNYSQKGELRFLFFYADLNYQTPGGLTLAEFSKDPQAARPSTKAFPGAVAQHAAVRNRTGFAGITNELKITERMTYVLSLFGSHTAFENPFITNYELRNETNFGGRTWLEINNKGDKDVRLKLNIGAESQAGQYTIGDYGNDFGKKDTVQALDRFGAMQTFAFTRFSADLHNRWLLEASLSYNFNKLTFSREEPFALPQAQRVLSPQLMPRIGASFIVDQQLSLRAIVSRGYSPPALQEVRAPGTIINTSLQPESGWNYEAGFRLRTKNGMLWWDVSAFYYTLSNAIVKRTNAAGQDYFLNAGGTDQRGVESQLTLDLIRSRKEGFLRGLQLSNACTFYYFRYRSYASEQAFYNGKFLAGVPQHVSVSGLTAEFPANIYLFVQYNYTGAIPLNDANSDYAKSYHLIQLKASWKWKSEKSFWLEISAGVDNLLDQRYSLGNDINAVGGRYYNAAPGRNYFMKLSLGI